MAALPVVLAGLILASAVAASGAGGAVNGLTNEAPLVDAGLDQDVTAGATVWLDGRGSVDTDGHIVAARWRITKAGREVDPTNATALVTEFVATDPGTYNVTLTVTDDDGASRSDTLFVTAGRVYPPSVSIDGPDTTRVGVPTTYVANATDADGRVIDLRWDDATIGETLVRTFWTPGETRVAVSATDDDGEVTRATKTVRVLPRNRRPTGVILGPDEVEQGTTARYTVRASDADGAVASIRWASGDEGVTVRRTFSRTGTVRLTAVVTDTDGASATLSKPVRVVSPPSRSPRSSVPPSQSPRDTAPPTLSVDGPRIVSHGSTVAYRARASDPDGGGIARIEWSGLRSPSTGLVRSYTFDQPAGTQVDFTVRATDVTGQRAAVSTPVWITGRPTVDISGVPEDCILTGTSRTLRADASDPDGVITSYTWRVDGEVTGHTSSFTHAFTRHGTVTVTLTVTDDRGDTASATRSVCTSTNLENSVPTIDSISGVWYQERAPSGGGREEADAFAGVVESQWPVIHYEAIATDPDGDELTFYWKYGDGNVGTHSPNELFRPDGSRRSKISYSYELQNSQAELHEYDVELVVEDEHGATTSVTRPLRIRSHPTGNIRHYSLDVSSKSASVGEPIVFYVETRDPSLEAENKLKAILRFGDGEYAEVYTGPFSGKGRVEKAFDNPGTYNVQLSPVFTNKQRRTTGIADTVTVRVTLDSYTEHHYTVAETETRVGKTRPGVDWQQSDFHHTSRQLEAINHREAIKNSQEARALETEGYQARSTYQKQIKIGTRYRRFVERPDSSWSLDQRNVDTVRRQRGWVYEKFSTPVYGSEWSLIRTTRERERIRQTTSSVTRPRGDGWTLSGVAGQKRVGWDYSWVDDRNDVPNDGVVVDTSRLSYGHEHGHDHDRRYVPKRVYYTGHDHDRTYGCVAWYYSTCTKRGWTGHDHDRTRHVTGGYWTGHNHDTWIHTHTDIDYRYRTPDVVTVWYWERTATVYNKIYEYRKPRYVDISRDQYTKPVYEMQTVVRYQKPIYNYTNHYVWERTVYREGVSMTYPNNPNVESVEIHDHDCPSDGAMAVQACTPLPSRSS